MRKFSFIIWILYIHIYTYIFQQWDRSHFLENLSGYEASCDMLRTNKWAFETSHQIAQDNGVEIAGLISYQEDKGDLDVALIKAIGKFRLTAHKVTNHYSIQTAKGCATKLTNFQNVLFWLWTQSIWALQPHVYF